MGEVRGRADKLTRVSEVMKSSEEGKRRVVQRLLRFSTIKRGKKIEKGGK